MILSLLFLYLALSPPSFATTSSQDKIYLKKKVMKEKQTEPAFSGIYLYQTKSGTYLCADCSSPLFLSKDQYNSGSGWPSFTQPKEKKSVYYLEDFSLPFKRYEVLCRSCNSHLGHVFRDGPPPKYLRYSINSISLVFQESFSP